MNDAVFFGGIALLSSMGAIVVVAALAGVLLKVLDSHIDHGEEH
ncbi:hypothetical protein [Teredinibacter sp. KSP-S5-2]|nr:hypothetical protein [Teredinibacter sp. KSP-S5-2]WNO08824.1 hypothetical protein P5V12_17775 [Teredinibacter sp. KSP-S5-2]